MASNDSKTFEDLLEERNLGASIQRCLFHERDLAVFRKQFLDLVNACVCEDDEKTFKYYYFNSEWEIDDEPLEGYILFIRSKFAQFPEKVEVLDRAFLKLLAAMSERIHLRTPVFPDSYCEMITNYISDEEEIMLMIAFGLRNTAHLLDQKQKDKIEWLLKARLFKGMPLNLVFDLNIDVVGDGEKLRPFFEAKVLSIRALCAVVKVLAIDFDNPCEPLLQWLLSKAHGENTIRKRDLRYVMKAVQAILTVYQDQIEVEDDEVDSETQLKRTQTFTMIFNCSLEALLEANAKIFDLSPEERILQIPTWTSAINNVQRSLTLLNDDSLYQMVFQYASGLYRLMYLGMGWSNLSADILQYSYELIYDICVRVPGALDFFVEEEDILARMLKMFEGNSNRGLTEILPILSMILHTDQNRKATETISRMFETIAKQLVEDLEMTSTTEHTIRVCTFLGAVAWNSGALFEDIVCKMLQVRLDCFRESKIDTDDVNEEEAFEIFEAFSNISGRLCGKAVCEQLVPVKEIWNLLDYLDDEMVTADTRVVSILQYIANMCSHPVARQDIVCCRSARFIRAAFISCTTDQKKEERFAILAWSYTCVARFSYQFGGGRQELYEHEVFDSIHFIKCLEFTQSNRDLVELAFMAMFNASKDQSETKSDLSRYGTAKVLLEMFKTWTNDKSIAQRACRLLHSLCRTKSNRKYFVRLDAANIVRSCAASEDFKQATLRVLKL